ncbi:MULTISPECIES: DUF6481 family protein [unclassified Ochrobactrum]|uniref:DUF6481 family protein n=1 Tax=unclassified Ochrobactrum TaxID=239106 RepID=UPI003096F282
MKSQNSNEFADRRSNAAAAKASLLNAYNAAKAAAEPSRLEKHAERVAIVEAREARRVERDRLKLEERIRLVVEAADKQAAVEAEKALEAKSLEMEHNARIARVIEDEAARKAERDRRYAQRKARQA